MFKRFLLATTAVAAVTTTAMAADLPSRRAAPAYVAVPVFTWSGFYIGANAGYAFSDPGTFTVAGNNGAVGIPSTINNVATGARPATGTIKPEGFTGGGQIGYNWQIGAIVLGVEADAAYTDLARTRSITGTTGAVSSLRSDTAYIGTVRGRLGYAFDRLLVYGTGGFAYGDVQNTGTFYAPPPVGLASVHYFGSRSKTATGWAAGGGVEYALPTNFSLFNSSAVTIKAEALYYDLGRTSVVVGDTGAAPVALRGQSYTARFENSGVIARVGLNFKFGTF